MIDSGACALDKTNHVQKFYSRYYALTNLRLWKNAWRQRTGLGSCPVLSYRFFKCWKLNRIII